jgi:ABC-type sugar transport system ATPase subunit
MMAMPGQSASGTRSLRHGDSRGDPFVGRQRELAALQALLDRVILGQGDVVLLVGEAGAGQTRLVREFAGSARQRGATILWGSCFEGDWQPAIGAYRSMG